MNITNEAAKLTKQILANFSYASGGVLDIEILLERALTDAYNKGYKEGLEQAETIVTNALRKQDAPSQ
jgi:hypothetical protein